MAETKRKIPKEPAAVRLERLLFARRLAGTVCRKKTGYQRKVKNERAGGDTGSFHLVGEAVKVPDFRMFVVCAHAED